MKQIGWEKYTLRERNDEEGVKQYNAAKICHWKSALWNLSEIFIERIISYSEFKLILTSKQKRGKRPNMMERLPAPWTKTTSPENRSRMFNQKCQIWKHNIDRWRDILNSWANWVIGFGPNRLVRLFISYIWMVLKKLASKINLRNIFVDVKISEICVVPLWETREHCDVPSS